MSRLRMVGVVLVFALLIGYFILEQSRNTTYQDVLSELIAEDEKVDQITVSTDLTFLKQTATAMIDDENLINRILNQEIDLKRNLRAMPKVFDHALIIHTNKDSYAIGFNLGSITVGSVEYKTANPLINPIYRLVNEKNLDWEIGPYNPISSQY